MGRRTKLKLDYRRAAIADEAARIIQEQGVTDFRGAKAKALERLGLRAGGPLPSNGEIEVALAERNRIFRGDHHSCQLRRARMAAIEIMRCLSAYHPRLVGAVLSGNTTDHSPIELHLFSDAAEAVAISLDAIGIAHRPVQRRQRLRHGCIEHYPGYRFEAAEFEFSTTVFPERRRHQSPLSPIDGRPMRRAGLREIERLVEEA